MTMKLDWQHPSIRAFVIALGALATGAVGLSFAIAAPADQPISNAPANEQPISQDAPPADTGTKNLPGPPNPFAEPAPAPESNAPAGRSSLAQPAPIQGPLGAPPSPQDKATSQGRNSRPNPFETQPSPEAKPEQPAATPDKSAEKTPDKSAEKAPDKNAETEKSATPPQSDKSSAASTNSSAEQPSEQTYTPAQQAVKAGIELIQKEKYEESLAHFDESLKIDPNEGAAYFYKGVAYRMLNRLDDAIDAFTKSIDLTTDDLDAQTENYLRRGIAWFYKGEYGIAWQDFDDATMFAKPEDPRPDFWKGLALARSGNFLGASNAYADAIQHDDHFGPAFVNLGLTLLALDEPKKAVYCFDQAIRFDSHNASNYFKRGVAQSRVDKTKEAIDSYTQAIKLKPDYAEAFLNRSLANRKLGNSEQADKDHADAVKINPDIEKQLTSTG
jgi:tetratricopeptide (TPR) repeat protein